jgi:hypothetical protein
MINCASQPLSDAIGAVGKGRDFTKVHRKMAAAVPILPPKSGFFRNNAPTK